jgi:hypothetical protein
MKKRIVFKCGKSYTTNKLSKQDHPHRVVVHYSWYSVLYDSIKHPEGYAGRILSSKTMDRRKHKLAIDIDGQRYWTSQYVNDNQELSKSLEPQNLDFVNLVEPTDLDRINQINMGDLGLPF